MPRSSWAEARSSVVWLGGVNCAAAAVAAIVVTAMLIGGATTIVVAVVVVGASRSDAEAANHEGKRDCGRDPAYLRAQFDFIWAILA